MNKEWMEVEIVTKEENVEPIEAVLYSVGVSGVSILNPSDLEYVKENSKTNEYYPESLNVIKDKVILKTYFKEEGFDNIYTMIKEKIDGLSKFGFDTKETYISKGKVNEENWENNWKKYFKPTKIGEKVVVKPTWEEYDKNDEEIVIELDPGMAFGTGTHETTSLCVKALEKYIKDEDTIFDIGTGSGILSIIASKLGATSIVGVDLDKVAVRVAKENIEYNGLNNIDILYGDLMEVVRGKANIVVANILAHIILELSNNVKDFIKEDGLFISSGIINDKKDEVVAKLEKVGFEILEVMNDGEWNCIVAKN
ncbi:50S ribosomal protein L11 methyltransferase [Clostridium sp. DL1XJH146]